MAIFATQSPEAGETSLGWSEAQSAAETRSRLNSILASLGSNDLLMFRGMYDISGSGTYTRSNLNIGASAGSGLNITDPTASNSTCFRFSGERVTFSDFTITSEAGFNPNRDLIQADGRYFTFQWGTIDCDLGHMIVFLGDDVLIQRNEFSNMGGYGTRGPNDYSTSVIRPISAKRWQILFNYGHHIPHEYIKTGINQATNEMPVVEDNHTWLAGRDFLDTTGGFYGLGPTQRAKLNRNVCKQIAIFIDAKFEGKFTSSFPIGSSHTKYVELTGNKIQSGGFITPSLVDTNDLLTTTPGDRYWRDAITEDLLATDNEVEDMSKFCHIKAGLNIVCNNTKKYGSVGASDIYSQSRVESHGNTSAAVAAAIYALHNANNPRIYTETGSTSHGGSLNIPDAPTWDYGPRSGEAEPSSDPLLVLSGSEHRTNTDLGATGPLTIMAGVESANGVASDSYTVTVS